MNVANNVANFTNRLFRELEAHFPKAHARVLALAVEGACRARSFKSSFLARSLPSRFSFAIRAKRIYRFFKNRRVQTDRLTRIILRNLKPLRVQGRVIILVDWTPLGKFQALVAAVGVAGRAVPISVKVTERKFDNRTSQNDVEELFLLRLKELIPSGYEWVVVLDRGFGRAELFRTLNDNGIPYVIRVTGDAKVRHGRFHGALQHCGIRFGETLTWTDCLYRSRKPHVRVKLVLHWNAPRREPSYWFLATNLPLQGRAIVRIYEKRMWIEESFRDEKWDIGLKEVSLSSADRFERLFLVVALTMLIAAWTGLKAEKAGAGADLIKNDPRKRAISLVRLGLEWLSRNIFAPPQPCLFTSPGIC